MRVVSKIHDTFNCLPARDVIFLRLRKLLDKLLPVVSRKGVFFKSKEPVSFTGEQDGR